MPNKQICMFVFSCIMIAVSVSDGITSPISVADSNTSYPKLDLTASTHSIAQIRHGEYLVKMADCITCHTNTSAGDKVSVFAGGLKMDTPFGSLYTLNITPDKKTGIGNWSDKQFVRAVREGIAPDGSYYYPVFPYNYFNKMSVQDVLDIKAYLDVIPAINQPNHVQEMRWPFNYRWLQWGWRVLFFYFNEGEFKEDQSHSTVWNRGAFIVGGPGHCALCHTQLSFFGVPEKKYYLAGAFIQGFYAPNISSQGLHRLANRDVANIFLHNEMPTHAKFSGPMKDVEHNSLRFLRHDDMMAIADYLKSVKSVSPPIEMDVDKPFIDSIEGRKLYESSCEVCHRDQLMGAPGIDLHVWNILLDQGRAKLYEVAIRGDGNMPAKGGCDACSNGRVHAAVDYMISLAKKKQAAATFKQSAENMQK